MVGHMPLEHGILVRVQVPQQNRKTNGSLTTRGQYDMHEKARQDSRRAVEETRARP